jgi:hypothetical protein
MWGKIDFGRSALSKTSDCFRGLYHQTRFQTRFRPVMAHDTDLARPAFFRCFAALGVRVPNLSRSMAKRWAKKGFLHGHEDLTASGEEGVDALGLGCAVEEEREVGATDGLETVGRDVGAQ